MATSRMTPDTDELVTEIHIAAPPKRVFEALIDPRQAVQWWGQAGMYRCTEFELDARVGGKWRSAGTGGQAGTFQVTGEILELNPPHLLVYSWVSSWTGNIKTIVRWELEPSKQGTLLRIRHCGLAAYPELAQSFKGWPLVLGWIQSFVERGETVDFRKPPAAS
jgi:uncharacterized protein YndB with AHSA1/START domain